MLPAERRVRRPVDFAVAVRQGRRTGSPSVVIHRGTSTSVGPARAGFVVGRSVGNATTRNRVRRQLRHQVARRLPEYPSGTLLVVRANPAAAQISRASLAATVNDLLDRALRSRLDDTAAIR